MNVLYVEDYALGAALVRDTFRRRAPDIHLDIISTVAQAVACLERFEQDETSPRDAGATHTARYDIVLTDLSLPDGHGLEILSHVRSRDLALAVVILTGSGHEDSVISALRAGANDYVIKRDNYLAVLPGTLRSALERFRSETARASNPLKVLYADADSADIERVRVDLYRRAPHIRIETVDSAEQVLLRLRSASAIVPDVLLLDYRLPGMPVIELLKEVGGLAGIDLPVVLVTGDGDERIAQLAMRLGVADYLSKADGYLQRLPFALESVHLKAASVRERAALRKSESEFRTLVNNLPDVVSRFDLGGRYLYVSPAIEAVTGQPPAHYLGKTHSELGVPAPLVQQFSAAFRRMLDSGVRQQIEFEAEAQGGQRWFESMLTPEHSADGKVASLLTIARDITERKRSEAAVRESELLTRSTVDALSAQLAILDERGTIIAVNRAWRNFAAANAANAERVLEGANYLEVCDAAMGSPEAGATAAGLRAVMNGELPEFLLEYPCHSPHERRWFNARATRFAGEGPTRVVVAHENVTQRKQAEAALRESEELFRAFFENAIDAILVTVADGYIIAANPSACRMFQRTEAELVAGGRSVVVDPNDPRLAPALQERGTTGKWRGELGFTRGDGSVFEAELTSAVFVDRSGLNKTCTIIRDITERKQAEARVSQYREHLEEQVTSRTTELARANQALTVARDAADFANLAKTSFLANMSHEIRTPMSSIIGLARLLRPELSGDKPLDYLGKLQQAADHLLRIINDVLDLSKIEAGQFDLEDADFALRRTITHAIDMLQERADEKGLVLALDVDPLLPAWLRGDALRLEQIVINFLGNAIKFTVQGTIHVRASQAHASEGEVVLRIEVQDAGIGMTSEQQARLFQSFSQADASISRQYGGTGLGLVIARRLAALMHGEVGVVSRPSVGSTFWMTARLQVGRAGEHDHMQGSASHGLLQGVPAGTRVLLAEDDPVNQLVTSELLKQLGCDVEVVDNGIAAVERVASGDYALVLMDMQMPLMDGLTATRQIRRLPGRQALPVVAMTANAFDDDRRACLEAGMNAHVAKPIEPDLFRATLMRCLAERDKEAHGPQSNA
ncbi:MAG: response regulator [Burkholderiaceae bacterium]